MLFLIANTLSFAKVPHSYVTENPKKEIQKVETFKQRDKAELNLSVTKLKTKEIEGKLINGKLVFDITDKKDIQEGNILVTQGTPYKSNNARVRSANPIQILEATKEANKLEVTGENLQDVYINVLDSKGQLAGVYKNAKSIARKPGDWSDPIKMGHKYYTINIEITDEYEGGYLEIWQVQYSTRNNDIVPRGIKILTKGDRVLGSVGFAVSDFGTNPSPTSYGFNRINEMKINNISKPLSKNNDVINDEIIVSYKMNYDTLALSFNKFPQKSFSLDFFFDSQVNKEYHIYGGDDHWWEYDYYNFLDHITLNVNYKPTTLKGNSTLTFAEYYPVNEFVQFTANPTIQNAQSLALDNSVKDVTLETTGKGLVAMQQGDKLTVDGHQVVIGAGGNIGPQKLTIGNVKYTYEVKNGKFRIALNEWGVLEPNRTIPIKIVRTENGKDKSLAEHNLTIKAPRRVEGTSNVKLNQDYSIRNTIRFNGISLQGAGALGLENPIPLGVSLTSTAGQGIPFMKEGDRLEISDGLTTRSTYSTRGVKAFTIGPNGTLGKQQVKLNNGELTVFVEGGKLRVGVNNWLVNNTINSSVRLVRGTNEIMNHTLDIKVPEAPFNVKKNGLLDFGNVTAGSKRTAETDIVLEMLQDVSDVKFSLKDPQPMLENLGTGDNLKVNRIEYLVSKQDKRDYKVKLKGNLTIPEGTKSGLYTGSTILELKIK